MMELSAAAIESEELSAAAIAREVEETRMRRLLQLDSKIASLKLERECLASQVRNEMMRDGVKSSKLPGVGTFKLYPPKDVRPCDGCMEQFGFGGGSMDPYLGVYADKDMAA